MIQAPKKRRDKDNDMDEKEGSPYSPDRTGNESEPCYPEYEEGQSSPFSQDEYDIDKTKMR